MSKRNEAKSEDTKGEDVKTMLQESIKEAVSEAVQETIQEMAQEVLPTTHVNASPLGAPVPAVREPKAPAVIVHDVSSMMLEDADSGISTDAKDNVVPFMRVLQALSPQLDDTKATHIEGAKVGDILLPNYAGRFVSGAKGILFQPCAFYKAWPEFVPRLRGGGFKGRYDNRVATRADVARMRGRVKLGEDIPDLEEDVAVRIGDAGFPVWERPVAGTELIYTRYHPGFAIFEDGQTIPYVIDLKSTGHKVSKNWMSIMNSHRLPNGRIEPSWARLYHITTGKTSNPKGTFAQYVIEERPGLVDEVAYLRGRDLFKAFTSGEVVLDEDVVPDEGGEGGGGAGYADDVPY
jgi:hypothetical protein